MTNGLGVTGTNNSRVHEYYPEKFKDDHLEFCSNNINNIQSFTQNSCRALTAYDMFV